VTEHPTSRNPFALLAAYVAAALRPERRPRRPLPEPQPQRGRRRAPGRARRGGEPTYTIRPEQRPELLGAPPTSPAGDVDDHPEGIAPCVSHC
jgi:hypothetical protein